MFIPKKPLLIGALQLIGGLLSIQYKDEYYALVY